MSQINLNQAVQSSLPTVLPPTLPIAAPTGMSTAAIKLVIAVATLFFSAFIYIAFSKPSKPTCPPHNVDSQEEIERKINLLKRGMETFQGVATQEIGQIFAFNGEEVLNQDLLTKLEEFVAQLRYKYPVIKLDENINVLSNPAYSALQKKDREDNAAALEESKKVDDAKAHEAKNKEEMEKALTLLLTEMEKATLALKERFESMKPLVDCWRSFQAQARVGGLDAKKGIAKQFSEAEAHFMVSSYLNVTSVDDRYKDCVQLFKSSMSLLEGQKAQLEKSYKAYTDSISTIHEKLAWVRLKKLYEDVGEETFREKFNTNHLSEVYKDGS